MYKAASPAFFFSSSQSVTLIFIESGTTAHAAYETGIQSLYSNSSILSGSLRISSK